jgi:GTP-binding protein
MTLPVVAIVGRPNVGKSSLFNCLAKRRIAIVDPTAGVTRDRVVSPVSWRDTTFDLTDTGGMGVEDVDNLTDDIERQIRIGMEQAQVIVFLVDARAGVTPLDQRVAERLRTLNKPVILVVNKCDVPELDQQAVEFYRLGFGDPMCVSAQHGRNRERLLDIIQAMVPITPPPPDPVLKLAIVGRRNTGKSTFINSLAGQERVIVSEVAGTTRDSIDVRFEKDGMALLAIDTAGVRKRRSVKENIEFYSLARAQRSIRRADVVLLFLEPRLRISRVDKQLAEYILDLAKPAIFVINKWDLVKGRVTMDQMGEYVRRVFPSLTHVPIDFITAKTGKNVPMLVDLSRNLHKQASHRVSTPELNRVIQDALGRNPPPMRRGKNPRVYFATQASTNPPTLVLFCNGKSLFDPPYLRYLEKSIRDHLGFADVAINLVVQGKNQKGAGKREAQDAEEAEATRIHPPSRSTGTGPKPRKASPEEAPKSRGKKRQGPKPSPGTWDI